MGGETERGFEEDRAYCGVVLGVWVCAVWGCWFRDLFDTKSSLRRIRIKKITNQPRRDQGQKTMGRFIWFRGSFLRLCRACEGISQKGFTNQ